MKKGMLFIFILLSRYSFPEDFDESYYDYGSSGGITIYGDSGRYEKEKRILEILNQDQEARKIFIEDELLVKSGFGRAGNVKYRKTTGGEKAASAAQAITHGLFAGIPIIPLVTGGDMPPVKSFFLEEYDRLPKGDFYNFYSVLMKNELRNVSKEIQTLMELEYKLQIEFCNGVVLKDWNLKYYTEENIQYFEGLILSLPETRENIKTIKKRFRNIELPRIKSALEKYENPGELYLQARKNLSDILK
jgi:hypothetical protein